MKENPLPLDFYNINMTHNISQLKFYSLIDYSLSAMDTSAMINNTLKSVYTKALLPLGFGIRELEYSDYSTAITTLPPPPLHLHTGGVGGGRTTTATLLCATNSSFIKHNQPTSNKNNANAPLQTTIHNSKRATPHAAAHMGHSQACRLQIIVIRVCNAICTHIHIILTTRCAACPGDISCVHCAGASLFRCRFRGRERGGLIK